MYNVVLLLLILTVLIIRVAFTFRIIIPVPITVYATEISAINIQTYQQQKELNPPPITSKENDLESSESPWTSEDYVSSEL